MSEKIVIKTLDSNNKKLLIELCSATLDTIRDNNGFNIGFSNKYNNDVDEIEKYFQGVTLIPERTLYVALFNNSVAGSIQLVKQPPSYETMSFACSFDNHFVAPWARGHGIARKLIEYAEKDAKESGHSMIKISVRSTRNAAIKLYESLGFKKWGELERYEKVLGKYVSGQFFYKDI